MKDSDIGVIVVIYAIATWFLVMTLQLPRRRSILSSNPYLSPLRLQYTASSSTDLAF